MGAERGALRSPQSVSGNVYGRTLFSRETDAALLIQTPGAEPGAVLGTFISTNRSGRRDG
jgi:hypothetical protein